MKSPLVIILELFAGLIKSTVDTVFFVFGKLGELLVSLLYISTFGIFGFLIAILIGSLVFVFAAKLVFKSWKSLSAFSIALITVFIVLILLQSI